MSEKKSRPVFTAEFKADAVELVLTSKESVSAVARQLDVSDGALRRWVKDFKFEHPEHDDGAPGPVDWQKYKALEARNRELDNGGEVINHALINWAGDRDLFFTRSRPYKSNCPLPL